MGNVVDDFLESDKFRSALIEYRDAVSTRARVACFSAIKDMIRANYVPPWQPIDKEPKDGDEVWLYCPGDHPAQCAGFFSGDAGGRWEHCSKVIYDVEAEIFPTHWMPLPDDPRSE